LISLTALFLLSRQRGKWELGVYLPLLLFVLFGSISTLLAWHGPTAWIGSERCTGFSTYICCIILFILATRCNEPLKLLAGALYAASFISILVIMQSCGLNLVPYEPFREGWRPYGTFGNPDFLGTYTVFMLTGAIGLYLQSGRIRNLLCTGLIYAALLLSLTRGSWLAGAVVFAMILVFNFKPEQYKKLLLLGAVLVLVTAIIIPARDGVTFQRAATIAEEVESAVHLEDDAGSNRMSIWKETLKLAAEHWAWGIGADNLEQADIRPSANVIADKAHNNLLEIWVTMGIFTLLAYLAFLVNFVLPPRGGYNVFSYMIIVYMLQGLFNIDVVMIMPLYWIILGLLLAYKNTITLHNDNCLSFRNPDLLYKSSRKIKL
jgi:O-antigen ligase